MDKHDKKTKMDTALLKVIRIILVDEVKIITK